jgi:hypothetical protein
MGFKGLIFSPRIWKEVVRRVTDVDQPSHSIKEVMDSGKVLFYDWQIDYF